MGSIVSALGQSLFMICLYGIGCCVCLAIAYGLWNELLFRGGILWIERTASVLFGIGAVGVVLMGLRVLWLIWDEYQNG